MRSRTAAWILYLLYGLSPLSECYSHAMSACGTDRLHHVLQHHRIRLAIWRVIALRSASIMNKKSTINAIKLIWKCRLTSRSILIRDELEWQLTCRRQPPNHSIHRLLRKQAKIGLLRPKAVKAATIDIKRRLLFSKDPGSMTRTTHCLHGAPWICRSRAGTVVYST